jgi:hypothetical protein
LALLSSSSGSSLSYARATAVLPNANLVQSEAVSFIGPVSLSKSHRPTACSAAEEQILGFISCLLRHSWAVSEANWSLFFSPTICLDFVGPD